MNADVTLHGRARDLARLALTIGAGTDGLRIARLRGAAGIGTTSVAERAALQARDRGFETVRIAGRPGSLATPLAPLGAAFPALARQIEVRRGAGQPLELDASVRIVHEELRSRCEQSALLVVIDDAGALDASSLAVLAAALTFETEPNLSVLLVETTDVTHAPAYAQLLDALGALAAVQCVELGPLDQASIERIVEEQLGIDAGEAPATVVERAAGNPWFAIELGAAWRRGERDVPRSVAAAAISALHALPNAARELVQLCALAPNGLRRTWLEQMAGADGAASLAQAEACGLVGKLGAALAVHHPLMRSAIASDMSVALKRLLHRELADAIALTADGDVVAEREVAFHLAAGGRPHEAVAQYAVVAARCEQDGVPHEAYDAHVCALECETRVDARIELLRTAARSATYLGIRDAARSWNELARMAAAVHDDELYAYALVQQYWASHDGTAVDRLRRAANLGAERIGWAARAAATLARLDGNLHDAVMHDSVAIDVARRLGDAELEVAALEKLASSQALLGNALDAIATCREAIDRAITERLHDSAALTWGCLVECLVDTLDNDAALLEARAADDYLASLGLTRKRPALLAWQTSALLRRGDLAEAARVAEEAVQLDRAFRTDAAYAKEHFGALVALLRAEVANETGDAQAVELADAAAARIEELGYYSWQLEADFERARAIARRDGMDAALELVANVEASGEPAFVASVARWLVRTGVVSGSTRAVERARELRAGSDAWAGSAVAELTADEIDVTLAAVHAGAPLDALHTVAARWRSAMRHLDALRVEQVIGALQLERDERAAARATLQTVFTELTKRHATADLDLVAALLRRSGSRTRAAIRQSHVGTLTQRELEIAQLAASGARNRDIAAALFITENTVTAHMTSVYEKTEVGSRVRLAAWLRQQTALDGIATV